MRTVRENAAFLAAVATSNVLVKAIAEAVYDLSIRRSLRAIQRSG